MGPSDIPAGPLAVDTGVFSWLHDKRGRYAEFAPLVAGHPLALPFCVVAELKTGAIRAKLGEKRRGALDSAIGACVTIPTDVRVVDKSAEIYARFIGRLKGGGVNDVVDRVHGLPVVTDDQGDFGQIAGEFPDLRIVHPDL